LYEFQSHGISSLIEEAHAGADHDRVDIEAEIVELLGKVALDRSRRF
jgi:hypothetical protein